jgi:O-antigen/teichoic acid export membrane protein
MGLCSLLVSLFFIYIIRPVVFKLRKSEIFEIQKDHFCYGKWALGTNVLLWSMSNIYFVILPVWIGLEGIAGLRALMNLSTPVIQANSALSFLFLPILSKKRIEGASKIDSAVKLLLNLFIIVGLLYFIGLVFFGRGIMSFLYNNRYSGFAGLVPLVGLLPLLAGVSLVLESTLRSLNNPDKVFWSYLVSMFIVLFGGILFTKFFGLKGVLYSYDISYLSLAVVLAVFTKIKVALLSKRI